MSYDGTKHHYIFAGGTIVKIAPHLALSAPAYGTFGKKIWRALSKVYIEKTNYNQNVHIVQTKMALMANGIECPTGYPRHIEEIMRQASIDKVETNDELDAFVSVLLEREDTKSIIMNAAICDFEPRFIAEDSVGNSIPISLSRTSARRLSSSADYTIGLTASSKIIPQIRKTRKDIFLVGFKTTSDETPEQQFQKGLKLLKESSCNLVVANDIVTKNNFIITPEEAKYHDTVDRTHLAENLAEMIFFRTQMSFTRSTVVDGKPIPWNSELVPSTLRTVVNHLINNGAYKPFMGRTVGHFAAKIDDKTFLTSIRKTNFNDLEKIGLVKIQTDGLDSVIAYGARPSVGGQSQRKVFEDHPNLDCIVHAHVPLKPESRIRPVSQREYECGSHQCGNNTSENLLEYEKDIFAVMLDKHGPNVVFNHNIDPNRVISFIERNFDLSAQTR